MNHILNVKDYGAVGDGIVSDNDAIQRALNDADGKNAIVYIPGGNYRISKTLYVGNNTEIRCDSAARLFLCEKTEKHRGDFLLSNRDVINGNHHISLCGGVWDGNFDGKNNTKAPDLFDQNAWSGSTLNFMNVHGLTLSGLAMRNSVVYYIRVAKLDEFVIRDISLASQKPAFNQDGLHFCGEIRHGLIENITAESGQTNDDMIALNADDSMVRLENLDTCCGDIEDLTIRGIFAENCYTGFRMLSVNSRIRDIRIENVYIGCRHFAINMDGARYCRTPLIQPGEKQQGSGHIENVSIDNMTFFAVGSSPERALILTETEVDNFKITNFRRDMEKDEQKEKPTLLIANAPTSHGVLLSGDTRHTYNLRELGDSFQYHGSFDSLEMHSELADFW